MDPQLQHHIQSLEISFRILATYIRERDGAANFEAGIGKHLYEMQQKMAPTQNMHNVYAQVMANLMKPPEWL